MYLGGRPNFLNSSSLYRIQWRLAQLAAHLVVALVALVVVGGATRVMEAGLACPDWPLCFGSLLPGSKMNAQVFLEWFHRLDAFLIGITLLVQLLLSLIWRAQLPRWLPWFYSFLVLLVLIQGGLGALTVVNLLPSGIVTAHLALALTLVAAMSGLTQRLLATNDVPSPLWWRFMSGGCLIAVFGQSLLGARMATTWAAQRCLNQGQACHWLALHRTSAIPITAFLLLFVITSLFAGEWSRSQWRFLLVVSLLSVTQITLGVITLRLGLHQPWITISHQLVATLLVACLAALSCRSLAGTQSSLPLIPKESRLETCHG